MSATRLPSADAAWLHMDSDLNPMVVNAVIWFDELLDPGSVREILAHRLVEEFPRFSRRVTEPLGRPPRFEDDPDFDIDQHLHRLALPAPGDRAALEELVSDLITPPLDPTRPLWHVYLIEGYGAGCALLFRIHHCIADGIALARVMLSLTDEEPDAAIAPPSPPHSARPPGAGLLSAGRRAIGAVAHEGMETLLHPRHAAGLAAGASQDAGTLAKLLTAPADRRTVLNAPLHGTRRVAWSKPFRLDRVKRAGKRSSATINDVLVAALTGALHRHLTERDSGVDDLHVMVPFNLRPLDQPLPRNLGNDFGLILLSLPVGLIDSGARLREVKMRMDAIKGSHEGPIAYGMLSAIGMTPPAVEDRLIGFFTDKASAVVTNVPGPRSEVYFAGSPVRGVLVWAPCSGSIGMTVSIFSYAGKVTVGFMTDTGLVPDPKPLVEAFDAELRALCR
ncbi:MAG TPA: wax ester/triacylglycerol synthase family O-acyltransferase [Thermoleophilaceae bacterium]